PGARRKPARLIKEHWRLDLHAGKARRVRPRVESRKSLFKALFDRAASRTGIGSGEDALVRERRKAACEDIGGQRAEFGCIGTDRDVRHIALAGAQQRALIALLENALK